MELEIRRRESTGSGTNTYVETETLAKFELMDGVPVRGLQLLFTAFLVSLFGKMIIFRLKCMMLALISYSMFGNYLIFLIG